MKNLQKVTIIGLGYVGFPLACAIAKNNNYEVYGLDTNKERVDKINMRISPVEDRQAEKDIKEVIIYATTEEEVLKKSKFIIVCVPTPIDEERRPDLTPVIQAAESISRNLQKGQIIILESTVNPGVCEETILPILERGNFRGGIDFELIHCPERIDPGNPNWNVYNINRNIGGLTKQGTHIAANFYRSFLKGDINEMSSLKVAESTKIVENAFRDVNIAYVNELAQSFDKLGIDVYEVINGASNKPFAFMPHYPGCGVGGHCIAVDPYYLIEYAAKNGFDHQLLKVARSVNNSMPHYTVQKLVDGLESIGVNIKGAKIGLLGLSYKANIGDMRESPALEIKKELEDLGAIVLCCDPYCNGHAPALINEILENCIGLILATNHHQFMEVKNWKNVKIIVDGRNCLDMPNIESQGIIYEGIGRGFPNTPNGKIVNEI
ncbi:nucleotide sugar dehydrogenase [Candidatus Woesearchaeota archaeon]|nr:nucleotide sugar dehydrogenase [Candidatus Woesearchaeota archaeon]